MNDDKTQHRNNYLKRPEHIPADRICTAPQLQTFGIELLVTVGASRSEAQAVIDELVAADLAGHASHGVMRLTQYLDFFEAGALRPGMTLAPVTESSVLDVFDGKFGFGQHLMRQLMEIAVRKARDSGSYTAFGRNFNHVGRLGSYVEEVAKQGFLTMMMVNVNGSSRVAPYGAIEPRLGTNPICIALPYRDRTIMVDTTTCVTAEGKLRIAMLNNRRVPDGQILAKDGTPTNDPADFYTAPSGSILPLGGPVGYKGSGLSILVEMICGILSGAGFGRHDVAAGTNAVWFHLIDLARVIDLEHYATETERFVEYIKGSHTAAGVDEVLMPGEREYRQAAIAQTNGITIPGGTWLQLSLLAARYDVRMPESVAVDP